MSYFVSLHLPEFYSESMNIVTSLRNQGFGSTTHKRVWDRFTCIFIATPNLILHFHKPSVPIYLCTLNSIELLFLWSYLHTSVAQQTKADMLGKIQTEEAQFVFAFYPELQNSVQVSKLQDFTKFVDMYSIQTEL